MLDCGFPTQDAAPTEAAAKPSGRRMLETTMQIALATDMGYAKPTMVAIMSILEHARRGVRVHVLGHNLNEGALRIFKHIEAVHPEAEMRHVPITDDMLPAGFSGGGNVPHMTSSCLSVLHIPKLIRQGRVLYLDSDILAYGDISPLFDMSMGGNLVAAVRDLNAPLSIDADRMAGLMNGRGASEYFNSGVVLFDCDGICEAGLDEELARIEGVGPNYEYPDQDRLNEVFAGKSKLLDYKWNMYLRFDATGAFRALWRLMDAEPVIRHYMSPYKPWKPYNTVVFESSRTIEFAMDVMEYREKANGLLAKLFGKEANVLIDYNFGVKTQQPEKKEEQGKDAEKTP